MTQSVALILLVAFAAGLTRFEQIPDTIPDAILCLGVMLILTENLLRRAGRRTGRRRFVGTVAAIVLLPTLGMAGWAGAIQLVGNIQTVEPGRLYRSAQLDGPGLANVIQTFGIRTVLNLRGDNRGQGWYDEEIAAVTTAGVSHFDIPMSAREEPDETKLQRMMTILRTAPQPILVHCQSGSDRTGLASPLYELDVMGKPAAKAEERLSFFDGHFP